MGRTGSNPRLANREGVLRMKQRRVFHQGLDLLVPDQVRWRGGGDSFYGGVQLYFRLKCVALDPLPYSKAGQLSTNSHSSTLLLVHAPTNLLSIMRLGSYDELSFSVVGYFSSSVFCPFK
jgi:hypothetical protein